MEVLRILNAWRSPLGKYFQVITTGQSVYELTYLEADDQWSIETNAMPTNLDSNKESS